MAKLVFLIGNGFDLNCGLKSRYKDAYEYYLNKTNDDSEIIKKFKKDLRDNHENWSDFEMGISNYAKNLSSENELIECIRDFRKSLKEYLTSEETNFYDFINTLEGIKPQINNETNRSLKSFYKGISNNISRSIYEITEINFITFNYTSVLDNLIYFKNLFPGDNQFKMGIDNNTVIHIHGSFINTPVIGIDRIEQLNVSYDLSSKGKRTVIKPTFNSDVDKNRIERVTSLIWSATYICTFGLSLRLSDLTWREEIISWLQAEKRNQLFVYDFSAYEKTNLDDDERLDIEEELKNKLFHDWGIDTSSVLWNQIHMPCGNKIFNYKEVIDNYMKSKE